MTVFERLLTAIPQSPVSGPADSGIPPGGVRAALGQAAGATLGRGLYRLHTADSAAAADRLVTAAYPDFEGRIACFGMDWLGRQFSLDPTRGQPDDPKVLLFDVGAGAAMEIPTAFSQFHDSELTEHADAALAATFFDQWLEAHPRAIQIEQCVGYHVPLFLGGVDGVQNLDVIDLDVYLTLTGQLRVAALGHS